MCGFVGVFNKHPLAQTADQEELIKQMNQMIINNAEPSESEADVLIMEISITVRTAVNDHLVHLFD